MNKKKYVNRNYLTTTRIIALGFLITVIVGTILLSLPIASANGTWTDLLTAAFTSTTSVCVTGLVVVDTFSYWSLFGKGVILILIQIGGLGIVSIITLFMLLLRMKITLKSTMLLQDAFNLNSKQGLLKFTIKVIKGTFLIEGIGALIYSFYYYREYGFLKGIWFSVFHAVSAFCNAGIDIMGADSLISYHSNLLMMLNTSFLIIMGGIGFIVWWDTVEAFRRIRTKRCSIRSAWNGVHLQTKIAIFMTLLLLIGGTIVIYFLERSNPDTLGNLSEKDRILNAFFQSVTFRTAGFAAVSQVALRPVTAFFGVLLMMIGGSPVGTAGGMKTVTIAVIFYTFAAMIRNHEDTEVFKRSIPVSVVKKAVAIVFLSMSTIFIMTILLLATNDVNLLDALYEVASAVCTVGLSRNLTPVLNTAGKIIIIICMYIGRVGPISMVVAFNTQNGKHRLLHYPEEDVIVG